jgi:uncharacterized protein (TIGR03083 family)
VKLRPEPETDRQAIAAAVTAERLGLCDLLDTLTGDDWDTPSLCPAWTVHDVLAHLTLATCDTVWDFVKGAVKARGSFDRMNADMARQQASRFAPPELIRQLRDSAASTRRAPLSSPIDPLVDVLVHGQDITRPLGRVHPVSPEHAVPALNLAIASRWYGGTKRFRDVRLIATDTNWSAGTGDHEACGATGDLLLIATGRRDGLARLSGPGVGVLASQLG